MRRVSAMRLITVLGALISQNGARGRLAGGQPIRLHAANVCAPGERLGWLRHDQSAFAEA